jgi:hypothetical protein
VHVDIYIEALSKVMKYVIKTKCLNISRAPTNLKAVPQEVATMMIIVYICTNFSVHVHSYKALYILVFEVCSR